MTTEAWEILEEFPDEIVDDREPYISPGTPEVPGPNSTPSNDRFNTSTINYAAGMPRTNIMSETVKRAIMIRELRSSLGHVLAAHCIEY